MTSKIIEFLKRHKKKLLFGTIIIGGAVIVTRRLKKQIIDWQERETKEFINRSRKQQHFNNTENICTQTIRNISSNLFDAIDTTVNIDYTLEKLRNGVPDKLILWTELKVLTFAHACTLVYAYAFLAITLRVQLNVIGGYMFKDTVNNSNGGQPVITCNLQQSYLSLCHYFMNDGIKSLFTIIHGKVDEVIGPVSLKKEHGLHDIEELFFKIQTSIALDNANPLKCIQNFVFPPSVSSHSNDMSHSEMELLNSLFTETVDILECEDARSLTGSLVCRGFSYYIDILVGYFASKELRGNASSVSIVSNIKTKTSLNTNNDDTFPNFCDPYSLQIPLAKLIPIFNNISKSGLYRTDKCFASDELFFLCSDKIKKFGENIYESFSN